MANNQYVNKVQFGNTIVIDISQDTVTSSAMLSGYTAHAANGANISGNITTKTSNDLTASGTTITVPSGYYSTAATKTITDNNLIAGNIKSGVTIFGVTGAYEGSSGGGVTQDENGYIILPSTGSGGGSGDNSGSSNVLTTTTGTFTGDGTNIATISCAFEPREIYIQSDLTSDESLRGIVTFVLIKDNHLSITNDSSTSNTTENAYKVMFITGYNESNSSEEPYASYSNGTLTINTVQNSGSAKFASGITYNYKLVGIVSSQHTIHLEFTDNTSTDINVAYTDALIGTMITTYTPTTYGQKTVSRAALDNVTWYTKPTIVWETIFNDNSVGYYADEGYPYCWIADLADVSIPDGSIWRITFDGVEYILTGIYDNIANDYSLGNPLYNGGTDDNSGVPFFFWHTPWGAWSGGADVTPDTSHSVKIERQVT